MGKTADEVRGPLTRADVLRRLDGWTPEDARPDAIADYLEEAAARISVVARELAPLPQRARVLEIGANPYHLTLLMREARPDLAWTCTNWFGPVADGRPQAVVHRASGRRVDFAWRHANVEREPLPFADECFDCVVYCEVLEHLFENPARSFENIHRVLRHGGWLLITTPNPARSRNLIRLLRKQSVFDAFSIHGPYGRHNREYAASELFELLVLSGFEVEHHSTIPSRGERWWERAAAKLGYGDYHLLRARRGAFVPSGKRPGWLHRGV